MEKVTRKIRFRLKWNGKIYTCPEDCLSFRDKHIYTNIPKDTFSTELGNYITSYERVDLTPDDYEVVNTLDLDLVLCQLAGNAMQTLLARNDMYEASPEKIAEEAVKYADALVNELKKKL